MDTDLRSRNPHARAPAPAVRRSAALDGLRGFALIGMLGWHAQLTWLRGGFARMTVFFVLAGFLAARSYERRRAAGADRPFLAFWKRRAIRLLPVTVLGVAWALVVTAWVGSPHARNTAFGDTVSVLLSVSNWRFIADERPYAALFDAPSAFQHYWSLSLEEQCFLLLPLLLGIATLGGRVTRRATSAIALGALAVACAALPFVVEMAPDTAYYGTHVRLGEFLAGVVLALVLHGRDLSAIGLRPRRALDAVGVASLAALALVMLTIDRDSGWLYRGGMGVFALPAVAVIAAAVTGGPAVNGVLGIAPLRNLGRWAFSIYVVHWPLYQVFDDALAGWPRAWLAPLEIAAAVVLGFVVHHLVERPLMEARDGVSAPRRLRWWRHERLAFGAIAVAGVACVVAAFALPPARPAIDFEQLQARADREAPPLSVEDAREVLRVADVRDPLLFERDRARIGVAGFGGSSALVLEMGKGPWIATQPHLQGAHGYAQLDCGLLTSGRRGVLADPNDPRPRPPADRCVPWRELWAARALTQRVDVAMVFASQWDLRDWQLDGDDRWRHIGDPVVDAALRDAMTDAADVLHEAGAGAVVFVTPSPFDSGDGHQRATRYRELLEEALAGKEFAHVVDLTAWLESLPEGHRTTMLPDGVHPTEEGAEQTWFELLGPALGPAIELVESERR